MIQMQQSTLCDATCEANEQPQPTKYKNIQVSWHQSIGELSKSIIKREGHSYMVCMNVRLKHISMFRLETAIYFHAVIMVFLSDLFYHTDTYTYTVLIIIFLHDDIQKWHDSYTEAVHCIGCYQMAMNTMCCFSV